MGTDQYPRTCAKIHNIIVHWWNRAACYSLRAPPGAVVFAQDNENDSANSDTHTNNGHRYLQDLRKVKCFR